MRSLLWLASILFLATLPSHAQTEPSSPPKKFEVASIRLGDPKAAGVPRTEQPWSKFPTNRFFADNVNLKLLIGIAYGVDGRYITGGPDWLDSQLYQIEAKAEGDQQLTYDQIKPLLQHLLEERLGLKVHHEMKDFNGFALVVAPGGPKLKPTSLPAGSGYILPTQIRNPSASTTTLALLMVSITSAPVVDKTGLSGNYDINLKFSRSDGTGDQSLPSFFTAVQEQLGLKLTPQKVPIEMLVIDHVDRIPTED